METYSPNVIIICGPTASGKSKLAYNISNIFNGEIINADSLQLYMGLPILTSQPAINDDIIKHHLYGVLEPESQASVGLWYYQTINIIKSIHEKGKLPIVVGGTGFYIKTLIDGMSNIPDTPNNVRSYVKELYNKLGIEKFYNELKTFDPEITNEIKPTDKQRMQRAYEVKLSTGYSLKEWWKNPAQKSEYDFTVFVLDPEKKDLYEKCNERFFTMIENGAIDEIINFRNRYEGYSGTVAKAIGLRELIAYIDKESTLEDAVVTAQKNTRNYAKRQITWFKNKIEADYKIKELDEKIMTEQVTQALNKKLNFKIAV